MSCRNGCTTQLFTSLVEIPLSALIKRAIASIDPGKLRLERSGRAAVEQETRKSESEKEGFGRFERVPDRSGASPRWCQTALRLQRRPLLCPHLRIRSSGIGLFRFVCLRGVSPTPYSASAPLSNLLIEGSRFHADAVMQTISELTQTGPSEIHSRTSTVDGDGPDSVHSLEDVDCGPG